MKNILLLLGMFAFINANAQITLEHIFNTESVKIFHTENYGYVYVISERNHPVEIYNTDFQLIKSVNIATGPNVGWYWIGNVSDKLFNSDNKIEILYETSDDITYVPTVTIINEDGTNVFVADSESYQGICQLPDGFILMTSEDTLPPPNHKYRIYSLPGSTILDVPEINNLLSDNFPNPSHSFINIVIPDGATEISVFNSIGKLCYSSKVSETAKKKIETNSLPSGTYFYVISGKTPAKGKFLVVH